jgi:hypothetical protein
LFSFPGEDWQFLL